MCVRMPRYIRNVATLVTAEMRPAFLHAYERVNRHLARLHGAYPGSALHALLLDRPHSRFGYMANQFGDIRWRNIVGSPEVLPPPPEPHWVLSLDITVSFPHMFSKATLPRMVARLLAQKLLNKEFADRYSITPVALQARQKELPPQQFSFLLATSASEMD